MWGMLDCWHSKYGCYIIKHLWEWTGGSFQSSKSENRCKEQTISVYDAGTRQVDVNNFHITNNCDVL